MMLTRTTQHNWTSHSMLFIFPALPHTKPGEVWRSCCYNCQHTSVVSSGTCITDNHLLIAKNSKPGFQSVSTEIGFCSEWIRICTNMHSLSNPRNSILSKSPCLQWHQNSSLQRWGSGFDSSYFILHGAVVESSWGGQDTEEKMFSYKFLFFICTSMFIIAHADKWHNHRS